MADVQVALADVTLDDEATSFLPRRLTRSATSSVAPVVYNAKDDAGFLLDDDEDEFEEEEDEDDEDESSSAGRGLGCNTLPCSSAPVSRCASGRSTRCGFRCLGILKARMRNATNGA